MSTKIIISVAIVVAVFAGYLFTQSSPQDGTNELSTEGVQGGVSMEQEMNPTMGGTHTMSDGTVMNGNANTSTMTGGHMMPDGTMMGGAMETRPTPVSASKDVLQMDYSMMGHGTYEAYTEEKIARAATGDVVLFFHASWCPTCKVLDSDLKLNLMDIPKGVTILDVNYDTETALKEKYGVTYQHTLVQVDAQGLGKAKWSGSRTLADLVAHIK
jgi:thiol-disulfide isomerase/thioredoxin